MNINLHSTPEGLYTTLFWFFLWTLLWVVVLANALARKDFDPVTRVTWVLVIILVPFFGVLLYWVIAPKQPCQSARDFLDEPTTCAPCGTAIPAGATHCPKCGWTYAAG
jgi:hypothetical protein